MDSWTCPYCGAYSEDGRCIKCGAFFEDKFDDVVEEEIDTTFEKKYIETTEVKVETIKKLYPTRCKRKKKQVFGVKMEPLIVGVMLIIFLFAFTQSAIFEDGSCIKDDIPETANFYLDMYVIHANLSRYNGLVDVRNHELLIERLYISNGECVSDGIYDINADLVFQIFNEKTGLCLTIHELSFVGEKDWDAGLYSYPVFIQLADG